MIFFGPNEYFFLLTIHFCSCHLFVFFLDDFTWPIWRCTKRNPRRRNDCYYGPEYHSNMLSMQNISHAHTHTNTSSPQPIESFRWIFHLIFSFVYRFDLVFLYIYWTLILRFENLSKIIVFLWFIFSLKIILFMLIIVNSIEWAIIF